MKKKLSMFLAASMMISCLAGCGGTNGAAAPSGSGDSGSASSGEIEEVVMLYPGEETDAMENFIDNQLNPRLNEEVGINLKLIYKVVGKGIEHMTRDVHPVAVGKMSAAVVVQSQEPLVSGLLADDIPLFARHCRGV